MPPFFSIIICVYNREQYLLRALNSLRKQEEQDWEVVIVDDGSTDASVPVAEAFAKSHPGRSVVQKHSRNLGVASARNTGIEIATGRYITFLDSDDEFAPNHLSKRRAVLNSNSSVRFLYGGVHIIGNPYVADKNDHSKLVHLDACAIGGSFVIEKSVFDEVGDFRQLEYGEDSEFFERALAAGIDACQVRDRTYWYYRDLDDQITKAVIRNSTVKPQRLKLASVMDVAASCRQFFKRAFRFFAGHVGGSQSS